MTWTRFASKGCAVLLGAFALPLIAAAQSAVTRIAPASSPFVHSYSPCRDVPPDAPVARDFYRAVRQSSHFTELTRQLDALRLKPVELLSPVDIEVYFLLLRQMEFRLMIDRQSETGGPEAIMAGRAHGQRLAERIGNDHHARCAWLSTETGLMSSYTFDDAFSGHERSAARGAYIAFIENALAGKVVVDKSRHSLHRVAGEMYLDQGFEMLPDTARAALPFEAGARHLLVAAANIVDPRYKGNWERYAFMLAKLPLAQQREIVNRLLSDADGSWAAPLNQSATALETLLNLLNVAGNIATSSKDGKMAVAMYERYLNTVKRVRQADPGDPNAEVNEVLAYLLVGDARLLAGRDASARQAYRDAERLFAVASADAKEMLRFQDIQQAFRQRTSSDK